MTERAVRRGLQSACWMLLGETVGKLEVDGNPGIRDSYQVQGIPTLMLFRDGQVIARHEGAIAKPQLQAFLDANL